MTYEKAKKLEEATLQMLNEMTPEEFEYLFEPEITKPRLWHEMFEFDLISNIDDSCFNNMTVPVVLVSSYDLMMLFVTTSNDMTISTLPKVA